MINFQLGVLKCLMLSYGVSCKSSWSFICILMVIILYMLV